MPVLKRQDLKEILLDLILREQRGAQRPLPTELPVGRPTPSPIAWDTGLPTQQISRQRFEITTQERPQLRPPITRDIPTREPARQPLRQPLIPQAPPSQSPAIRAEVEEPVSLPFWQRALQVFAAPFVWVDETMIQPGLAIIGTTAGFVEEVKREPGEDFWEWKKRSWAGWDAPGFNLNVPWSDEPWRIDLKGVMEIAPWLLIPGVGQVGTGAKAARGIAGKLGKLETVGQKTVLAGAFEAVAPAGRALGTIVEYSPWGLVEKTAGVAIKGGVRAVGAISERVSTQVGKKLFGEIPPPPPPTPAVQKLNKYMGEVVVGARKSFKALVPEKVTAKQLKGIEEVSARYRRGEISWQNLREEFAIVRTGGIKAQFALTSEKLAERQAKATEKVRADVVSNRISKELGEKRIARIKKSPAYTVVKFSDAEVKEYTDLLMELAESGHVRADSVDAFLDFIGNGTLPMKHNLRDWSSAFGEEFAKTVSKITKQTPTQIEKMFDAVGIVRAVKTMADLSGTLRQGLFFTLMHPTQAPKWFYRQVRAFTSEKWALERDAVLRADPLFKEFTSGVGARRGHISPLRQAGQTIRELGMREEGFMTTYTKHVPLLRRSERAFVTYINEGRLATYKSARDVWVAQGAGEAELGILKEFINNLSGRGALPKILEKYNAPINALLFSAKLQAATVRLPFQLGKMLISKNPYMRKTAARALIPFLAGGAGLIALINANPGNKVELDPRAGNFGKIKIGETRLDIWRGYLQYLRFGAQLLSGERKSAYGNMNKVERGEIAGRFIQSKLSPIVGLFTDLWKNENYRGEPLFSDTTGFSKTARDQFLPLAVQDVIDAMEESGVNGLWVAIPVTLGIGALTFVNDFVKVQQRIAREMGYKGWDEIDPKTQRIIENTNAELQVAQISLDRQIMGTAWGDYRLAAKAIEEVYRENVDLATAEFRETGDGYRFREKIADANSARRGGYAARDKELRFEDIVKRNNIQDTLESDISVGPEQMAIRLYNEYLWSDDMFDEFRNYKYDEADIRKAHLISQMGQEMFDYVEEYRGAKHTDFPPEYQELVEARTILKPYWEVKGDADRYFGLMDSSNKRAFIKRHRDLLKRTNPLIAKYVRLFYTQTK